MTTPPGALLAATGASLAHGPIFTVVVAIGLVFWLIAIISAISRWRR